MTYRGIQPQRTQMQAQDILRQAGQTATWRQYISASASAGASLSFGSAFYYRQQIITAYFGNRVIEQVPERQTPAGMLAAANVWMVCREQIGRRDEILWRGSTYRVDGDPVPAYIASHWAVGLKRATT